MNKTFRCTLACILAAVVFLMIPLPGARAEDDSNLNKGVLVGLFVVIVGVAVWLGFQSDMENHSFAALEEFPAYPAEETEGQVDPASMDELSALSLNNGTLALNAEGIGFLF